MTISYCNRAPTKRACVLDCTVTIHIFPVPTHRHSTRCDRRYCRMDGGMKSSDLKRARCNYLLISRSDASVFYYLWQRNEARRKQPAATLGEPSNTRARARRGQAPEEEQGDFCRRRIRLSLRSACLDGKNFRRWHLAVVFAVASPPRLSAGKSKQRRSCGR